MQLAVKILRRGVSIHHAEGVSGDQNDVGILRAQDFHQAPLPPAISMGVNVTEVGDLQGRGYRAVELVVGNLNAEGLDQSHIDGEQNHHRREQAGRYEKPPAEVRLYGRLGGRLGREIGWGGSVQLAHIPV